MKTTPVQNTPVEVGSLPKSSNKSSGEQSLSFQMMLQNALNPELPTTPPAAHTAKTSEKKSAQRDESEPEPQAQINEQQAVVLQPPPAQQPEEQPAMPSISVAELPSFTELPATPVHAFTVEVALVPDVVPQTEMAPAGDMPPLPQQLPADDIVFAETTIILPTVEQEIAFVPEVLESLRPIQTDELVSQSSFDQLVAKSAEALNAKDAPVPVASPQSTDTAQAAPLKSIAPEEEPVQQFVGSPSISANEATADQPKFTRSVQAPEDTKVDESLLTAPEAGPKEPAGVTQAAPLDKAPATSTPAEQIQTQITEHLEQGKMEFRMQLNPESLGKIDVKMVLEGGKLTVELIASSAKTADLLSRQLGGLASSLRISGTQLQSVQVVSEAQNPDSHMEQSLNMMMGGSYQGEQQDSQFEQDAANLSGKQAANYAEPIEELAEASAVPSPGLNITA